MDPLVTDRSQRIPALDGLRAIAMLAVVSCHLIFPSPTSTFDWFDRVTIRGWLGVDLFFVLSGFLITGILVDTRNERGYFRSFYARRSLRIFPIYYLLLVILFVWIPFGSWAFAHGMGGEYVTLRANQSWYWTYLVNVLQVRSTTVDWFWTGHLWSLSVEEQFYLVWPAVVLLVPTRHLAKTCIALFVAAWIARLGWVATHERLLGAYVLTPMRMDSLAAGAFVAVLARTEAGSMALRRWYRWIGLAALAVAVPVLVRHGDDLQNSLVIRFGYAASAIAFACAIVWLLVDARPRHPLEWGPLRAIGRISYGGYLYHLPLIGICVGVRTRLIAFGAGGSWQLAIAHVAWVGGIIALTLIVASVSYRLIERPFLDLKDRLSAPHESSAGPIAMERSM
jgi:peptidoglycan/LPS O-acetylase OafA/YrhL